jgi:hypothetical protein
MTSRFARPVRAFLASRFALPLVALLAVVIASGLYVQWRHSRIERRAGATEADTMCIASRLGLPCQP